METGLQIYQELSNCRDYGLKDQMTRAAVSIASNIAEGAERSSTPDFIRFLNIAKGSAAELRTQVYIAERIGILNREQSGPLVADLRELSAMLQGLVKSLKKSLNSEKLKTENRQFRCARGP